MKINQKFYVSTERLAKGGWGVVGASDGDEVKGRAVGMRFDLYVGAPVVLTVSFALGGRVDGTSPLRGLSLGNLSACTSV